MATAQEPVTGEVKTPEDPLAAEPETRGQRFDQLLQMLNGDRDKAERVWRLAANALKRTKALADIDAKKLWVAVLDVAALNLPFGSRGAYLVPFFGEKTKDVQIIISPHGLIELAYRHPVVKSIQARVVHENDPFDVVYAPEAIVHHRPLLGGKRGAKIGAYMVCDLMTGGRVVEWMPAEEIAKVRAVSKSQNNNDSPWKLWEDEMWRKSALKRGMKYVPQSEDMMRALELDDDESDLALLSAGTSSHLPQLTPGRSGMDTLAQTLNTRERQTAHA